MACSGSAVRVRLAPLFKSIGIKGIAASISKVLNPVSNKFCAKVSAFYSYRFMTLKLQFGRIVQNSRLNG